MAAGVPGNAAPRGPILVAEDDPGVREMIQEVLEDEDWAVEAVGDGRDALASAARRRPSLVVLDMGLPSLDGYGVAAGLREAHGDVPILVLSAAGRAGDAARDIGAFAYLPKPFNVDALVAAVRQGLARPRGRGGASRGAPAAVAAFLPFGDLPALVQPAALRARASGAEAAAARAVAALRGLRAVTAQERAAREHAEAAHLKAVEDFRAANQQAIGLAQQLDGVCVEIITALAKAVDARDAYTGGHVERVCRRSLGLAEALGVAGDGLRQIEFGAVLHDVGKIGVPDAVLAKPGPLDAAEWGLMRRHPEIGRHVLEGIGFLGPALGAVTHHHERWDGGGYPRGLAGADIPLAGRIVAVADAFDAMTSDRPYRRGLPVEAAVDEIGRGRGTAYDPEVVEAFMRRAPLAA